PNEKFVTPEGIIPSGQKELKYTIEFQNTGNDTAFKIVIKDTLSQSLDYKTFRVIASSHPYIFTMEERVLTFTFDNILLPDSTTDESHSHGFIKYSISPDTGLAQSTSIKNTAHIYFDYNGAVATNTALNIVNDSAI